MNNCQSKIKKRAFFGEKTINQPNNKLTNQAQLRQRDSAIPRHTRNAKRCESQSKRFFLGLEYDGTAFHGFQIQPKGLRTIQSELEKALSFVANESIKVTCAGRTDAGVHAIEQVVHFDTTADRDEQAWLRGTNTKISKDISIKWSKRISDDGHARYSAVSRTYRYLIINQLMHPALDRHYAAWCRYPLNITLMQQAANAIIGTHDFSSFRSSECQSSTPLRNIQKIEIKRENNKITIEITANAFLHHMVRNIVGTLMTIGSRKKSVEWMTTLLTHKDRTKGDIMAPSCGLYLLRVQYC